MNEETKDHIIEVITLAGIIIGVFVVPPLAYLTGQVPLQLPDHMGFIFLISIVVLCYLEIMNCLQFAKTMS